jgi:hypothetical protein
LLKKNKIFIEISKGNGKEEAGETTPAQRRVTLAQKI